MKEGPYQFTEFEDDKFKQANDVYFPYMEELKKKNIPTHELIHQFPLFAGQVNLARYLFFYEMYKKVVDLTGHIAEVGIWKGASFLHWAKLVTLFEPQTQTQVYGFDWFMGMDQQEETSEKKENYVGEYESLVELVKLQNLQNTALICKMDVTEEMEKFIEERPYLRFKLLFIDCGLKDVMEACFKHMFPRLVSGGILIMDHYNNVSSPDESDIVDRYIEGRKVLQMPFNRHSTGYIVK